MGMQFCDFGYHWLEAFGEMSVAEFDASPVTIVSVANLLPISLTIVYNNLLLKEKMKIKTNQPTANRDK